MADGYTINVAVQGRGSDGVMRYFHFFATTLRSAQSREEAKTLYNVLKDRFPASEGYDLTVTKWSSYGKQINFEKENNHE